MLAEASKTSGIGVKITDIKDQIMIWVKSFGIIEHHATWSIKGRLHSVEFLQEHLTCIIKDSAMLSKDEKSFVDSS